MDILKSKTIIILIVMILSVAFIGGTNNMTLQDNNVKSQNDTSVNA
ncbi:MAG: hypothetical protein IKE75_05985 [Bacilli bacterium]|nr:hypothetical protein [Bacilli bacterium]